jgi:hypothetical protein
LIGPKKVAGGTYLQNTRDELQNTELYQSPAKALHEAPIEALLEALLEALYRAPKLY